MDKASAKCTNLEFTRPQSLSKQAKVRDFWKYIDHQDHLKPYEPPKLDDDFGKNFDTKSLESTSSVSIKETKVTKEKKPTESCKLEKYFREGLKFADSVEVPYDEIQAEIEEFHKRLLKCKNPKCKNDKCDCKKKIAEEECKKKNDKEICKAKA